MAGIALSADQRLGYASQIEALEVYKIAADSNFGNDNFVCAALCSLFDAYPVPNAVVMQKCQWSPPLELHIFHDLVSQRAQD